jgi:hypothetical protein
VIDAYGELHETLKTMTRGLEKDSIETKTLQTRALEEEDPSKFEQYTVRYKRTFAERHRIYAVEPHEHTYIMFKLFVDEKFIKYKENEFDDLLKVEEKDPEFEYEHKSVVYGWCPLKLFHKDKIR